MIRYKSFLIFCVVSNIFRNPLQIEAAPSAASCIFKSLNCQTFDKAKLEFKHCRIKAISRDNSYITVHAIVKEIATSGLLKISIFKRANGWKPFLYNISVNACNFLKYPTSNPVAHHMYNIIGRYSNLNHTCPYNHDVIVDKFRILNREVILPFPIGEYALDSWWKVNGIMWARVNGSCIRSIE